MMAKYCRLCKNRISVLEDSYSLSEKYKKIKICYNCDGKVYRTIKIPEDRTNEESIKCFEYLVELLDHLEDDEEAKEALSGTLNEIDGSIEKTKELIENTFKKEKQLQQEEAAKVERIQKNRENFILTTGYNVEGYCIVKYNKIVSGEIVLGSGFLSELSGQLNDFFGTNSNLFSEKIRQAKV